MSKKRPQGENRTQPEKIRPRNNLQPAVESVDSDQRRQAAGEITNLMQSTKEIQFGMSDKLQLGLGALGEI